MSKKKEDTPYWPRITADWSPDGPIVYIKDFELLSPVKIEKCFDAVMKEWQRQRATAVHERRKRERAEATKPIESVGAEDA